MSSSSKSTLFFLYHIKESIEAIASYLQDGGKDAFLHRRMVQMAVLHELVIIGEAANNLSRPNVSFPLGDRTLHKIPPGREVRLHVVSGAQQYLVNMVLAPVLQGVL